MTPDTHGYFTVKYFFLSELFFEFFLSMVPGSGWDVGLLCVNHMLSSDWDVLFCMQKTPENITVVSTPKSGKKMFPERNKAMHSNPPFRMFPNISKTKSLHVDCPVEANKLCILKSRLQCHDWKHLNIDSCFQVSSYIYQAVWLISLCLLSKSSWCKINETSLWQFMCTLDH